MLVDFKACNSACRGVPSMAQDISIKMLFLEEMTCAVTFNCQIVILRSSERCHHAISVSN
jgi:hypothetical protein